ncbi:MAG: hypothetical protein IJI54_10205 [Kiritimatiellae bacterium]|nr:hypothetical protein [Kiritimatiellia bacterium]
MAESENERKEKPVSAHDLQMKNTSLLAEYAHEMHQFIRQKAYETQVQFDKTLVYLCGGAIALCYGLFANTHSESLARLLFCAILSWGMCCFVALIDMVVLRWYFPQISSRYYNLYDLMNEQVRIIEEAIVLDKVLQEELSKIDKTSDITPEILIGNGLTEKQGAELSQEYEAVKIRFNRSIEQTELMLRDLNKESKSFPASNFFKLVFFVFGAIFFFVFVYRLHIVKAEQLSSVPEVVPNNSPVVECKESQAVTNCAKEAQEKRATQEVNSK